MQTFTSPSLATSPVVPSARSSLTGSTKCPTARPQVRAAPPAAVAEPLQSWDSVLEFPSAWSLRKSARVGGKPQPDREFWEETTGTADPKIKLVLSSWLAAAARGVPAEAPFRSGFLKKTFGGIPGLTDTPFPVTTFHHSEPKGTFKPKSLIVQGGIVKGEYLKEPLALNDRSNPGGGSPVPCPHTEALLSIDEPVVHRERVIETQISQMSKFGECEGGIFDGLAIDGYVVDGYTYTSLCPQDTDAWMVAHAQRLATEGEGPLLPEDLGAPLTPLVLAPVAEAFLATQGVYI